MNKKNKGSKIINTIFTLVMIIILIILYYTYKKYNFNEFTKAENTIGITKFTRDKDVKYGKNYSYKLYSLEYNDAIFYKKISVKPNTPYKLSCMVKTEDVENDDNKVDSGAQMSILDSTECSKSIIGTNDWQKLEFIFDSKNRSELEIGFRLGGNSANTRGTAWFTDFKLEEGVKDNTNNWKIAFFIMENVDVTIDNKNVKLSMRRTDIDSMKDAMERFKNSVKELSGGRMTADYDMYEITTPVKSVTYSEEFAYYLDPSDVEEILEEYLKRKEYD